MKHLTDRQQEVLDFILDHISGNGYPPTLREIAAGFGLSGPRAAVKHLDALERKGSIIRKPGYSRGIEVIRESGYGHAHAGADQRGGRGIPLLGTVPAGPMDLAVQEADDSLVLDASIARDATFLLRVTGDSMSGDHIVPGDLVLVKKQDIAAEGDIVIVLVGEEATLKRFSRQGKTISLIPSNPDHKPIVLDGSKEEVRIIGKVKAVIRVTDR